MRLPVVVPSNIPVSSEPRTQQPILCRSLCSQLASSPHDNHHRRRPCFQLARDRTTAHPAPTIRKPLLPTSKLSAYKLLQHPGEPGNVSPFSLYTHSQRENTKKTLNQMRALDECSGGCMRMSTEPGNENKRRQKKGRIFRGFLCLSLLFIYHRRA
jgi:hypothetical protein